MSASTPNMQSPTERRTHHFRGATDPDMATAKLVLESAIDALTRRTLVVANLLGKLKAEIFQAPGHITFEAPRTRTWRPPNSSLSRPLTRSPAVRSL